ncbi:MAG: Rrf2 family transcriptional regulator [Acidobacteriota bacterium]|nr:Rrf2 family transcriptional regulator [Acidobacteriota bacterium]MDQ7087605.1 Rrf2 family transcriptional regulator [Acidobacteriota bacterium]
MISQTAEYALRAVVCLAGDPAGPLTTQEIALRTQVPAGYLAKVLQGLAKAGLVSGQRGPSGGFTLSRPLTEITVLDVLDAVDPLKRIRSCPLGIPAHREHLCSLHRRLDAAMASAEESFRKTTIADLLGDSESPVPLQG